MPKRNTYSLGLSSFPLLTGETTVAAAIYLETNNNPTETRAQLQSSNLLQRKHFSTSTVAVREVVKRLKHADDWELDTLAENQDFADSSFLCTLLVSRQYPILLELVRSLIKYKYDGKDTILQGYEIENWYRDFLDSHPPKRVLKESTFKRLLINTRQILKEGGHLSAASPAGELPPPSNMAAPNQFTIRRPGISLTLRSYYENLNKRENLDMLLLSNYQIKHILESARGTTSSTRENPSPASDTSSGRRDASPASDASTHKYRSPAS